MCIEKKLGSVTITDLQYIHLKNEVGGKQNVPEPWNYSEKPISTIMTIQRRMKLYIRFCGGKGPHEIITLSLAAYDNHQK